ncbi:MAG: ATP phosphoribosyltransferase regulatory subunit [Clostridia bacterium]|nr:ATP phosphoribosyltransferase regulatory subunit [Clostridia bacterium]
MKSSDYLMKREERVLFALRALYQSYGYTQYKMGKFEEYDLYVRNKDFLVSDGVITFTDTDGRLMALKPDVTLSIIKNTRDADSIVQKVYYSENVYRISGSTRQFKEILQTGLECIGDVDLYSLCEVIALAAESLDAIDGENVLELSHMGVVSALVGQLDLDPDVHEQVLHCIGEKNADGVPKLCPDGDIGGVLALVNAHGAPGSVISALRPFCTQGLAKAALDELETVSAILAQQGHAGIQLDFSIVNDMNYYNGIVFRGYIRGIPAGVLSGGQYDKLMQRMGRDARAVGFAIYMDLLERLGGEVRPYDVDTVLLYDDGADVPRLAQTVRRLAQAGRSVTAQKAVPEKLKYRQLLKFSEGGLEILESHD